jgi:5'-nucleotidase
LIKDQQWESAAECAKVMAQALVDDMPAETVVVNLNVPDLPLDEIKGWRHTEVGLQPPRAVASADLEPIEGRDGAFKVTMQWGEKLDLDPDTDAGTVESGYVSVSYLSRIVHDDRPDLAHADKALAELLA